MSRRTLLIIVGVLLIAAVAGFGVWWFSAGSGAPTAPLTADEVEPASADTVVFSIVPAESEARFIIDEELRGVPTTVIGATDQVAGSMAVSFANPTITEMGQVRINARTLMTDNEFRNRALRGQILQSAQDEFEFVTFDPTGIDGLPETATLGEAFTFQLTGDLTVRDVTNSVTFDVTVTPVSEERIEGSATATVQRADYNLLIPDVPGVANVSEDVVLEIDFVAVPGTGSAEDEAEPQATEES